MKIRFSEVTDLRRIKRGDLLFIPPKQVAPRCRGSVSTLAGFGMSVGFTGRSWNSEELVKKYFVDRGDEPLVLIASRVYEQCIYDERRKALSGLLSNATSESDMIPVIRDANWHIAHFDGFTKGRFYGDFSDAVSKRFLKEMCVHDLFIPEKVDENETDMRSLDRASDFALGIYQMIRKQEQPLVNSLSGHRGQIDGIISGVSDMKELRKIRIPPSVMDTTMQRQFYPYVDDYHFKFGTSFVQAMVSRGAKLLRPSEEMNAVIGKKIAAKVAATVAVNELENAEGILKFAKLLVLGAKQIAERGKRMDGYAKKFVLTKSEEKAFDEMLVAGRFKSIGADPGKETEKCTQ